MATTSQNITLDTSYEHPALTPEMRHMAAELWEIVKARVDAEDFPLRGAVLRAYTDVEEVSWVDLVVRCDAPYVETTAFGGEGVAGLPALVGPTGRGAPGADGPPGPPLRLAGRLAGARPPAAPPLAAPVP